MTEQVRLPYEDNLLEDHYSIIVIIKSLFQWIKGKIQTQRPKSKEVLRGYEDLKYN